MSDGLRKVGKAKENTDAFERGVALRHLMHDVGHEVAGELVAGGRMIAVTDAVLAQREMESVRRFDAAGDHVFTLDLEKLGLSADQIDKAKAHQLTMIEQNPRGAIINSWTNQLGDRGKQIVSSTGGRGGRAA